MIENDSCRQLQIFRAIVVDRTRLTLWLAALSIFPCSKLASSISYQSIPSQSKHTQLATSLHRMRSSHLLLHLSHYTRMHAVSSTFSPFSSTAVSLLPQSCLLIPPSSAVIEILMVSSSSHAFSRYGQLPSLSLFLSSCLDGE